MTRGGRGGSTLVEFLFAGIPIILTVICVMEISRGMWTHETLAYAVKEGTRMAVVHGENCTTPPNSCALSVAGVAQRIADSSQGLMTSDMNVSLISSGSSVACNPLSTCLSNVAQWPASPGNAVGSDLRITATYPFQSPMAILFPGFTSSPSFTVATLAASSQERIQF